MIKILCAVGAALLVFGLRTFLDLQAFKASEIRVMAEVTEYESLTQERRMPKPDRVAVRYDYNGREYRGSNTANNHYWMNLKPGDRVELVLNPKDPSRFMQTAALPQSGFLSYTLMVAGAIALVFAFLKR